MEEPRTSSNGTEPDKDDLAATVAKIADVSCQYFQALRQFYVLFLVIFAAVALLGGIAYVTSKPVYVAEATVGPPNPSPVYSMISAMGTGGVGGGTVGIAKKLLGSGGNTPDTFQKFQLLLASERLYEDLADKDRILPLVFPRRWDSVRHCWRPHGPLHRLKAMLYSALQRPLREEPGPDDLGIYMQKSLAMSDASNGSKGTVSSMMMASSGYFSLRLAAETPDQAKQILSTVLTRSDEIIRTEQLQDVKARIDYINRELPATTQADARDTLIQILANQEEIKTMLVADKRFSYVLVSGPYASDIPVSPMAPQKAMLYILLASLLLWGGLVAATLTQPWLRHGLRHFRRD